MFNAAKMIEEVGVATSVAVKQVCSTIKTVADDPDITEAELRFTLRKAADLLDQLNQGNDHMRRHIVHSARRFGWLSIAWLAVIAWQVFDLVRRNDLLPW